MSEKSRGTAAKILLIVLAMISLGAGVALAGSAAPRSSVKVPSKFASDPHFVKPKPKPPKPYTFPDGGRTIFPNYRLVALYGTPDSPVLGALGQQPLPAAIDRAKAVAHVYQSYSKQPIMPAMEIITTVASASPTDNNDYSAEISMAKLQPWISAARKANMYVVLDLQPGRANFLSQAKQYAPLLKQPNVGLALDPEWRLASNQVPLVQIGSVSIGEVNQTVDWLAALTKDNKLPQKLLLLHEFRLSMIPDRQKLDTTHKELAYAIQMDGQGDQHVKLDTWHAITATPPPNVRFGWKNFYVKDSPTLSPAGTMQLTPQPWYISYQ